MPSNASSAPTAIVLLNLGGPASLDAVEPFLLRLFADREIIQLPFQSKLGPFIAKRRAPKVAKLYEAIGGGSPILDFSEAQGAAMCARLDRLSPGTAPHKAYVAFRYAPPFSDDALRAMAADGVERAVVVTMYPQWSCSTTGSSLNELARALARTGLEGAFEWSVIDRWPLHDGFVRSMASTVEEGLREFAPEHRDDVVLLFSAHSLPQSVVDRGDAYPAEVAASMEAVMEQLGRANPHVLAWQSSVGPVKWLGPSTESALKGLVRTGHRRVLVVPVAFTSDHIETLSEIDIEYAHLARELGFTEFRRAPALNVREDFCDALGDLAARHLADGGTTSRQYAVRCVGCTNAQCRPMLRGMRLAGAPVRAQRAAIDATSRTTRLVR
jgi:ferrochelatase